MEEMVYNFDKEKFKEITILDDYKPLYSHDLQYENKTIVAGNVQDSEEVKASETAGITRNKSSKWSLFNKKKEEQKTVKNLPEAAPTQTTIQKTEEQKVFEVDPVYEQTRNAITQVKDIVSKSKNIGSIINNLDTALNMLGYISEYAGSTIWEGNDSKIFLTHTNILTSMIGKVYVSIDKACEEIQNNKVFVSGSKLSMLKKECDKYRIASDRFGMEVEKIKNNCEGMKWNDVIKNAMKENEIDITDRSVGKEGQSLSKVDVIGEGENTVFFKEDVTVIDGENVWGVIYNKYVNDKTPKKIRNFFKNNDTLQLYDAFMNEYLMYQARTKESATDFRTFLSNHETVRKLSFSKEVLLDMFEDVYKSEALSKKATKAMSIKPGEELTGRNIATTKLAQLLGMPDVLVHSQTTTLVSGKEKRHGFVMSKASGTDYKNIDPQMLDDVDTYTGEFQRQMVMLQIFDNIIGQIDRHLNNIFYNTEEKGGKKYFTGITGIDNDLCAGKEVILNGNFQHSVGCLSTDMEQLRFECMDEQMYEHMKTLYGEDGKCSILKNNLYGLMSDEYIDELVDRFKIIMAAINNTIKKTNGKCLYKANEWGRETFDKLVDHKRFGEMGYRCKSYLETFVQVRYYDKKFNV